MTVALTAAGFELVDSYISTTPATSVDIVLDRGNAAINIIIGEVALADDGGMLACLVFTTDTLGVDDQSAAFRDYRTTNRVVTGSLGGTGTNGSCFTSYYTLGNLAAVGAISGERQNFWMEIHMYPDTSAGVNAMVWSQNSPLTTSSSIFTAVSNIRTGGNIHYLRFITDTLGDDITAYNIRQYALAKTNM